MVADNIEEAGASEFHPNTLTKQETEEYRPLNVKDALGYLDKVKAKFNTQGQVYNQFLDIMKDFKSQIIDTPGVIERVSSLFKGYPALISGFNTFLPPGYHIKCSTDKDGFNHIHVTTPSGTTSIKETECLNLHQPDTTEARNNKSPVEFNHAISYVNKIKNRFASQPETYKKFLEILQRYQKDQEPIAQVYEEIQVLFDGSNELLDEFKQFLPEPKQRKKRMHHIPTFGGISKRTKHHHDLHTSDVRSNDDSTARPAFSAEEAEFFEKVKTYIGNKATYNAFLKVLNLFSQQIVDQNVLVSRVGSFIGGSKELFDWFKSLVGYDGTEENTHVPLPRTRRKESNTSALLCGPSYRHTPKAWENPTCSGRDALCWDVLNDTYISHPTWASEDTGFVAAKKNKYEEALHRVEEERYDYDLNIEANLNTIALLEPIAKKISIMSPEEKASFRLSPGLGSPSRTIYQRIIEKIYGVEKGLEIIELLHTNPAQTVLIVLKRLKQKDDEWKRAQREWNKIWREVEAKNYWKSLDYQGITFKLTDRKAMMTRALVTQAEQARQQQVLDDANKPHFSYAFKDIAVFKDVSRLIYFYLDRQPVYNPEDCQSMRVFMNDMITQFFDLSDVEPSTIDSTVDTMMEEIVKVAVEEDDTLSVRSVESDTPAVTAKKNAARSERRGRRSGNHLQLNSEDDKLLKDVLTRNLNNKKSNPSSDEEESEQDEEQEDASVSEEEEEVETRFHRRTTQQKKKPPVKKNATPPKIATLASLIEKEASVEPEENQKTYNFFGDNGFYCFFRLYQLIYARLCKIKALDTEFRKDPEKSKRAREEAQELGITPKRFQALQMDTKRGYYSLLLALIDKLFEGEVDQQTFEECMRYIFGTDAYIMFTIDKLVLSLVRHIHIIITNTQSQALYDTFTKEHKSEIVEQGDVITYRTRVAGIIDSSENTYHISFKVKSRSLGIKLLDGNNMNLHSEEACGGYDEYVSNYIDWANETKGIDQNKLTSRFLKRNLIKEKDKKELSVKSGMQYKICRDTYHMFYIIGTEDTFVRHCTKPLHPKHDQWDHFVNNHWSKDIQDISKAEQEARALLE